MKRRVVLYLVILFIVVVVIGDWFVLNDQFRNREGFAVYLAGNNEPIISDRDIVFYNKTSHQIKLNEEGVNRTKKFDYFTTMYHKSFIVKLNGKEMYNGSFWSDMDSMSYSGVAIMDILAIQRGLTDTIRIEPCYPSVKFCEGVDPRDNSEIFDYFHRIGKLVQ